MNEIYLLIIWNKALWCKGKILNDLSKSFEILNTFYINWNNYPENLLSLYGRKLGSVEEKVVPCGTGKFLFILVKDNSPIYETRKMYEGDRVVNAKIYDKKAIYRKWTGGHHRIHCSTDYNETIHDLTVLFGSNYQDYLNIKEKEITLDTKGLIKFNNKEDLIESLKLFGDNKTLIRDNILYIFAKCRFDIVSFLACEHIKNNEYTISFIDNTSLTINIYGELDGDLPLNSLNNINDFNELINFKKELNDYIEKRNNMASNLNQFFLENYLDNKYKKINPCRDSKHIYKYTKKDIFLMELKRYLYMIKYDLFNCK